MMSEGDCEILIKARDIDSEAQLADMLAQVVEWWRGEQERKGKYGGYAQGRVAEWFLNRYGGA